MKKLYAIAGVLLAAVMLASIGSAVAEQVYPILIIPEQTRGLIWYFQTNEEGVTDFRGFDVKLRTVECIVWGAVDDVQYVLKPLLIIPTRDYVIIVFLPRAFPQLPLDENGLMYSATYVTGELRNGDTFEAAGPGFTYGRT
jgi:hypothetical protein